MARDHLCLLLALAVCAAGLPAVGEPVTLELESSFGGVFAPRVALSFTPAVTSLGVLHWKANASTAGAVSAGDVAAFAASGGAEGSGHYRLRARHPSGAWVVGSVRKCVLAAADWAHDVVFTLDAAGGPRNIEVRPGVAAGFPGCAAGAAAGRALPPAGTPWRTRFGVVGFEDVVAPAEGAFKGVPFPGQKEISAVEVLTTKLSEGGGAVDEATKAALAAAAAKEAAEAEGKKSWWERLQGYAMPIAIFFLLQRLFDGGKEEKKEGGGKAGGGRPAAAAAGAAASS